MGQGGTDYTYDGGESVVLDDHDRSKNSAQQLDGYSLDIRPDSSWPGLATGAGEIRFDQMSMREIATWLRDKQRELARVPADLETGALVADFGPSNWVQAANLRSASDLVARTVRSYSDRVLANLEAAATAIEASANDLESADEESAATARNVNSKINNAV